MTRAIAPPPPLRIVFAGTPEFARGSLQALLDHPSVEVVAAYTQPDRAAGRGRRLMTSAIKNLALARGLPVEQPLNWKTPEMIARFAAFAPDLLVVAAYGVILPASALDIPRLGAINVHASLLPRWRGAAPIQRAIMAGDATSGVTIMRVVPALDAGTMLLKRAHVLSATETAGSLEITLAHLGAIALVEAVDQILQNKLAGEEQVPEEVTYAAKITREDRVLDWQESAVSLERRIRALSPAPLAYAEILGLPLNILKGVALDVTPTASPGTLIGRGPDGIDVATADGVLRLVEVQPPGKRMMSARDFLNGYGQRLIGGSCP